MPVSKLHCAGSAYIISFTVQVLPSYVLNDTPKLGRLNRDGHHRQKGQEAEGFAVTYYLLFPVYVSLLLVFTFLHLEIVLSMVALKLTFFDNTFYFVLNNQSSLCQYCVQFV